MIRIYYFFQVDPFIQTGSLSMTTNSSRTTTAINSIDLNLNDDNEYESITTYAGYISYFGDLVLGTKLPKKNCLFLSGSCHFNRASNVDIGVECQAFVIVTFFQPSFTILGTFKIL